VKYYKFPDCT